MNLYFSTTTAVDVSEKPTSKQVASPWQRPAVEDQEGSENGEEESKKMFAWTVEINYPLSTYFQSLFFFD